MKQEIFRMERVTYKEKEVILLENFNMQIFRGEIMGMLTVNAHGMSAFLRLLQENLPLYDGYIYYGGEKINSWKESQKNHNRISIIGAQSRLVEGLSVLDNVFVLRQGFRQEIIRTGLLEKQLAPFMEEIGLDIPMDARVENLSAFERVAVELLRGVVLGHKLIVLHEIGALISYEELDKLHRILEFYAGQGFSFLYICPHFEEIASVCDRAAMLSNGHIQKIIRKEEMPGEVLKVYSSEYNRMVRVHLENRQEDRQQKKELLNISHVRGDYAEDISLQVYEGECLVIHLLDNGLFLEIKEMLVGNKRADEGKAVLEGRRIRLAESEKIAVVQELPTKSMIFPELDYMDNLCISLSRRMPDVWKNRRIRSSIRREYGPILGEEVFDLSVEELSEKQKYQMIYTRVLLQKPRIVFCIQPFKGADLSHRMFVWKMLEMLLNHGISVVILALNLSDALSLADRLLVVDKKGCGREILRRDFASIPVTAPWKHIYRDEKSGEDRDE